MRIVIIGAGGLGAATAAGLLERGHDVVLVERDKQRIDALGSSLDCGFVHGDGTRPAILREVGAESADFLLCLTGGDQDNIIASLVGRHLGFRRVVTRIEEVEFEHICIELGLEDRIVPDRSTARALADLVAGHNIPELSTIIRGDVRFFSFVVSSENEGTLGELGLPEHTRSIGFSRDDRFALLDDDTKLRSGDEVLVLTHVDNLKALRERFNALKA